MQDMKSGGGALTVPPSMDIGDMTKEEMAQKLISYQQFMAKYIVEAQQQKAKAVTAAEAAVKQKYEDKLLLAGSSEPPAAKAVQISQGGETKLYQDRSEKVSAAAKAGKSRWGDMENQRAATAASGNSSTEKANGIQVQSSSVPPVLDRSLFDKRNVMVAAAGKAGKSRWGEKEIEKATNQATALPSASAAPTVPQPVAAAAAPVPPEVAEADHGLRNDGGVGGPSLAERVNLGSQLFGATSVPATPVPAVAVAAGPSLFDKRNVMVAAAGKAGKSRWGDMEIQKAQTHVTALPSAGSPAAAVSVAAVPLEVQEADHGLRADGGVGGPSLAQRVNLGASLLGFEP